MSARDRLAARPTSRMCLHPSQVSCRFPLRVVEHPRRRNRHTARSTRWDSSTARSQRTASRRGHGSLPKAACRLRYHRRFRSMFLHHFRCQRLPRRRAQTPDRRCRNLSHRTRFRCRTLSHPIHFRCRRPWVCQRSPIHFHYPRPRARQRSRIRFRYPRRRGGRHVSLSCLPQTSTAPPCHRFRPPRRRYLCHPTVPGPSLFHCRTLPCVTSPKLLSAPTIASHGLPCRATTP